MKRRFLIIGNPNAVTYKEIFPLFQNNEMWWGVKSSGGTNMFFLCAGWYGEQLAATKPEGSWWKRIDGKIHAGVKTVWFTNIGHGKRHEPLQLAPRPGPYEKYDNYDAIEVPRTKDIPADYPGVMGVPITFLDKHCPEQFEIVGFRHGDNGKDLTITRDGKQVTPYFRILIRHTAAARSDT